MNMDHRFSLNLKFTEHFVTLCKKLFVFMQVSAFVCESICVYHVISCGPTLCMHECMRVHVCECSPSVFTRAIKHCSYVLALNRSFQQDPDSCSRGEEQEQEAHPKLTLLGQAAGRDPGPGLQH